MLKTLQFELWHTCLNRCKFCYLQGDQQTPRMEMIKNIQKVRETIINKDLWKDYDTVSFIGGEFFQGEMDNEFIIREWFDLIDILVDYHKQNLIKKIYFYATMTFPNNDLLWATLERFNGHREGIWVLTSYDEEGRFHLPEMRENWLKNVSKIKQQFNGIEINTTIICTGAVIEKFLENNEYFSNIEELGTHFVAEVLCGGRSRGLLC